VNAVDPVLLKVRELTDCVASSERVVGSLAVLTLKMASSAEPGAALGFGVLAPEAVDQFEAGAQLPLMPSQYTVAARATEDEPRRAAATISEARERVRREDRGVIGGAGVRREAVVGVNDCFNHKIIKLLIQATNLFRILTDDAGAEFL
jgi:hypothetical protein